MKGDSPPEDALALLTNFEQRMRQLIQDQQRLADAKTALAIDFIDTDRTLSLQTELQSLKEAWTAVRSIWKSVAELKDTPWSTLVYRKVRALR